MHESTDSYEFDLTVPGDRQFLAFVRTAIGHLARDAGFSDIETGKVEMAVDEACANVIEHAYRAMRPKPSVRIRCKLCPHRFVVEIVDQGESFDFNAYTPPSFPDHWEQGKSRGIGLFLIKKCVDEVTYRRLGDHENEMRLVKNVGGG